MFNNGEMVRVKGEKPGSINEFAIVKHVYDSGKIWIANLNAPFAGTLSDVVEPDFIEKM